MRALQFLALALVCVCSATSAPSWQTGPVTAEGSHQFLFATDGSPAAAAFERDVLGDANVGVFLENYRCWRLDAASAQAAGITRSPALVLRNGQGQELWRRDSLVQAPELITALVVNAPPPASGAAAPSSTSTITTATTTAAATTATAPAAAAPATATTQITTDLSGDGSNPAADLVSAGWALNGATLTLSVTVGGTAQVEGFHLYMDTDNDQATGFNTTNILGADRMIEGATVYNFGGAAQTDWTWQQTGTVTHQVSGSTLTLTIPLQTLGLTSGQSLKVSFGTTGSDWAPADWMPDGQPVTVTVP